MGEFIEWQIIDYGVAKNFQSFMDHKLVTTFLRTKHAFIEHAMCEGTNTVQNGSNITLTNFTNVPVKFVHTDTRSSTINHNSRRMIQDYRCEYEKGEFSHAGDLGDIIWGTAAIRLWLEHANISKGTLYLYDEPGTTTHAMTEQRANLLIALLSEQAWLKAVWSPHRVMSDLNGFRSHLRASATIAGAHCCAIGLGGGFHTEAVERRWLDVPTPPAGFLPEEYDFVFVRTKRYRSHDFPWSDIINWFGHSAIYLGLTEEYDEFVRDHPAAISIRHVKTENLLQTAQIIDKSKIFFGNQTSLFAIAEALKKPRVLESFVPLRNCEYGSRNCLAVHPGTKISKARILELLDAPFTT